MDLIVILIRLVNRHFNRGTCLKQYCQLVDHYSDDVDYLYVNISIFSDYVSSSVTNTTVIRRLLYEMDISFHNINSAGLIN